MRAIVPFGRLDDFISIFSAACPSELAATQVKNALESNFPDHDVVPFLGAGSMRGQLELFSKASMIVGPHGAGLSNMIVAPLHTPVLEIGPISCPFCYLHLSLKVMTPWAR